MKGTSRSLSEQEIFERVYLCKTDPWYFFTHCVYTLDQADREMPVKRFPVDDEMGPYLKLYTRIWQKERFVAVPKSRRMFMSWTNIALYLWDCMWGIGREIAFVSKKEDDSNELIKRAHFIFEHIPEEFIPKKFLPKCELVYGRMSFPEQNSSIRGFAQGADQLRQFTHSGILADEMAFWEDSQKMYASAMPTIEGGGKFTAISSAGPGFFKRLVFDNLDDELTDAAEESNMSLRKYPMEGVEVWKNPKNKFYIYQLHYSANPKKRDLDYRDVIKSTMPIQQYLQEYEIRWDSYAGQPVYRDFQRTRHGSTDPLYPEVGLPLLRGWDFGLTPACIVGQLVEGQLRILREFTAINMGADRFSDYVLKQCAVLYPFFGDKKKDWRDFIDPAGAFRKDTDEGTCAQVLAKKGISPIPGPVAWEARRQSVETFLLRQTKEGPGLLIDLPHCPVLVRGFDGGYRYPEKSFEIEPGKIRPLKDEHSHIHDALQYLCSKVLDFKRSLPIGIAVPSYSFSDSRNRGAEHHGR